jgi:hypothetical protein
MGYMAWPAFALLGYPGMFRKWLMKKAEIACKYSRVFPMDDISITESRW